MKRLMTVLCVLCLAPVLFGQTESVGTPPADYAIQFQIIGGPQLTDFQGGTFSGWMRTDGKYDYRFGVELATYRETTKNAVEETECETYVSVSFQWLRHTSWRQVCMYYGFGPALTYGASKTTYKASASSSELKQHAFGIGAVGVVGAEVFIRRDISLTGEYGMLAGYTSSKYSNSSDVKSSKLYLGNLCVRFGISVYLNK
ncbi:MAG TPA: hypothetical protein ENN03_02945 [bacterium]|nr:hypothetical protein [bacterium]